MFAPDGLNFQPRVAEPESALIPGMAATALQSPPMGLSVTGTSMPDTSGPGPTALQNPAAWVYDFDQATGSSRATFNGEVIATTISAPGSGVASFNGRTGAVTLTSSDITAIGGIVNPSPALTGNPTAPTQTAGDSTTKIATTAFVAQAIVANPIVQSFNGRTGAVSLTGSDVITAGGAPAASPALTGTPTTPTPAQNDQSSKIASTMFVANAIASGTVTSWNGRQGAVNLSLSDVISAGGAPIASPVFTGTPAGTTAAPGNSTTQLATTAFVTNAVTTATTGVASFNTRTGAVTLTTADVTGAGGAPILSPNFTGTPQAPTQTAGDSSTKLATTAFVGTAIANLPAGVATFNGRSGTVTLQLTDVTSAGGAPLAAPTFTGAASSTTPTAGDNSTRIATTAFVAGALPAVTTALPAMDGTAAIGASGKWADGAHVHPTDTSRAAASALANYLPLAGGTLTGTLGGTSATFSGNLQGQTLTSTGPAYFAYSNVTDFLAQATAPNRQLQFTSGANLNCNSSTGTLTWNWSNTTILTVDPSGNLTIANNGLKPGGGPWTASSDARIKTVDSQYGKGLAEVIGLNPVVYRYKGNDAAPGRDSPHRIVAENRTTFVGLIAQEAETIFPDMVTQGEGWIDGVNVQDMRTLDTSPLIFALINAIKELKTRVENLEQA